MGETVRQALEGKWGHVARGHERSGGGIFSKHCVFLRVVPSSS